MSGPQVRIFVWHFDAPPQDVWPVLADTERFNEAAGIPRHVIEETPRPDGGVDFIGRAKVGLFNLLWDEVPANWVANRWFHHRRSFRNGPLKSMAATLRLAPDGAGTRAEYTLEAEAANLLGRFILATRFFSATEKNFARLAAEANEFCAGRAQTEFDFPSPVLAPGGAERLAAAMPKIEQSPFGHGLASRLADYVVSRPEVDIRRIRPLELARKWNVPERHAIELCLQAAREDVLAMRWDLLCPRCQVSKATSSTLDQLPTGAHCETCNVDYGRDYTSNIELAFYPNSLVRRIDGREFCLFGPWSTPHVVCQITVPAGGRTEIEAALEPGSYRLRTLEAGAETTIEWADGAFPDVIVEPEGIAARGGAGAGRIGLVNATGRERTIVIEERGWRRGALTAARATSMQAFRDLCATEILRPGDNLEINSVTFMFTDLQGSTALYEKVGDSHAFSLVRDFFAVLAHSIRSNNGTVVKTIGDAVHGAFDSPRDALLSAVQIQRDIEAFNSRSGRTPIAVKLGLHVGRCIAVTLNERLDYYGTTVNKAARLADQSAGGDIVLSQETVDEPAVGDILARYTLIPDSAALKGFDDKMPFFRISRGDLERERESSPDQDQARRRA